MDIKGLLDTNFKAEENRLSESKKQLPPASNYSLDQFFGKLRDYRTKNANLHKKYHKDRNDSVALFESRLSAEKLYERKEKIYSEGKELYFNEQFYDAYQKFISIKNHKDADDLAAKCLSRLEEIYGTGVDQFNSGAYEAAVQTFTSIIKYKNSSDMVDRCKTLLKDLSNKESTYVAAVALFGNKKYKEALDKFITIRGYKESDRYIAEVTFILNDEIYKVAVKKYQNHKLIDALLDFQKVPKHKEAPKYIQNITATLDSSYNKAVKLFNKKKYKDAKVIFHSLIPYRNAKQNYDKCEELLKKIANDRANKVSNFFSALFGIVLIIGMIAPIGMTIASAIILFSNSAQIHTIGNFAGWCTGWVFFLIGSIILGIITIIVAVKTDWDGTWIPALIGAVLATICAVVVFPNTAKLKKDFNPADFISISLNSKEDYSYGSTKLTFTVFNNSAYTMTYFKGKAVYYNMDSVINTGTIDCTGTFSPHSTNTMYVYYDSQNIKNTSFTNLGATFQMTEMAFGNDGKFKITGKTIDMKARTSTYNDSDYNTSNQLLNNIRKCSTKDAILPDNYTRYTEYEEGITYFSYSDYSDHKGCSMKLWFSADDAENYVENFCSKLVNNGFNRYYKQEYTRPYDYSDWECEYRKNDLIVEISGIMDGDQSYSYTYDAYVITSYYIMVYYLIV